MSGKGHAPRGQTCLHRWYTKLGRSDARWVGHITVTKLATEPPYLGISANIRSCRFAVTFVAPSRAARRRWRWLGRQRPWRGRRPLHTRRSVRRRWRRRRHAFPVVQPLPQSKGVAGAENHAWLSAGGAAAIAATIVAGIGRSSIKVDERLRELHIVLRQEVQHVAFEHRAPG